jgi:hypothetical protein
MNTSSGRAIAINAEYMNASMSRTSEKGTKPPARSGEMGLRDNRIDLPISVATVLAVIPSHILTPKRSSMKILNSKIEK